MTLFFIILSIALYLFGLLLMHRITRLESNIEDETMSAEVRYKRAAQAINKILELFPIRSNSDSQD